MGKFLFPRIDMFVGSSTYHELFCFMDSLCDYNQIRMYLNSLRKWLSKYWTTTRTNLRRRN